MKSFKEFSEGNFNYNPVFVDRVSPKYIVNTIKKLSKADKHLKPAFENISKTLIKSKSLIQDFEFSYFDNDLSADIVFQSIDGTQYYINNNNENDDGDPAWSIDKNTLTRTNRVMHAGSILDVLKYVKSI